MSLINIKDDDFKKTVLDQDGLVLVDFWAEWCGPCKQIGPLLEEMANNEELSLRVAKINIDENQQIAAQLRIQSIPTVFAFNKKQIVDAFQGVLTKNKIIKLKKNRRNFLQIITSSIAAVGTGFAIWPFIDSMNPSADVLALGSKEFDLSNITKGYSKTVKWRGKPIFIKRRTEDEIAEAKAVKLEDLKHPEKDEDRAKNPEWLVMIGVCTHLGCVPLGDKGEYNGWFCPCHGSHYDTSGRIRKGPAPTNLEIPKYEFVNSGTIKIG